MTSSICTHPSTDWRRLKVLRLTSVCLSVQHSLWPCMSDVDCWCSLAMMVYRDTAVHNDHTHCIGPRGIEWRHASRDWRALQRIIQSNGCVPTEGRKDGWADQRWRMSEWCVFGVKIKETILSTAVSHNDFYPERIKQIAETWMLGY